MNTYSDMQLASLYHIFVVGTDGLGSICLSKVPPMLMEPIHLSEDFTAEEHLEKPR